MSRKKAYNLILGIAPCSRGFGFGVLESGTLVESGLKFVRGQNKNLQSLAKAEALIEEYQPEVLVLEDTGAGNSRRDPRIPALSQSIAAMSLRHQVPVAWFKGEQVRRFFVGNSKGTKLQIAEHIASRFPQELGDRVPPKRRPWDGQDSKLDLFFAVALTVMMFESRKRK